MYKEQAQTWLGSLRNGTDQYDSFIGYVREEARNGNLSLADIGTSEEELEQLRIKGCSIAANTWLGYLRNGTDNYDLFIGYVRKEARKGNLSLADIGTSEEELAELRIKGCKTAALQWLGFLRNGSDEYDSAIGYVREHARDGNLSLADIGTSDEELAELRIKGCKTAALKWLGYLRDGGEFQDSFVSYVREEVQEGNLLLADIGTSEEELASFVR